MDAVLAAIPLKIIIYGGGNEIDETSMSVSIKILKCTYTWTQQFHF